MKKALIITASIIAALYIGLSVYALWPVSEYPVQDFAGPDDCFIEVDGFSLRYIEQGDPAAPALVLVHGFAGSVYTYRKIIPLLSPYFHVIAVDLPGFGLSDKPDDFDYRYDSQGRIISRFIEQLGLSETALAGHSMGGNIVLHSALDNRKISRLILLDPGIIDDGNPEFLQYLVFPLTRISAKLFRSEDFRMSSFESSYYRPEQISREDIDAYMLASRTENYVNAIEEMLKNYAEPDELNIVPSIGQPVLLLWGEYDGGNPPENGRTLDELFQNSEFHLIEDSGHYIHEEQPEVTANLIIEFLMN